MRDEIPEGLRSELLKLVKAASALLLVMRSTKRKKDRGLYAQALVHFRNTTARISCRLDTLSYFCTKEAVDSFLRTTGCKWDRRSEKVLVDSNDEPPEDVVNTAP